MGHVPAGPVREAGQGDDVPRREHRGTRARKLARYQPTDLTELGRLGETLAAAFLEGRGLRVLERNLSVGRGEIDLLAVDGSERIAVEVKTRFRSDLDPMENFTAAKRLQVRALASSLRPRVYRVDFVGVAISDRDVLIRWVPHAA